MNLAELITQLEAAEPALALPVENDYCPHGEGQASGSGCIKPNGHDGPHIVTPGVNKEDDWWRAYTPGQEGLR